MVLLLAAKCKTQSFQCHTSFPCLYICHTSPSTQIHGLQEHSDTQVLIHVEALKSSFKQTDIPNQTHIKSNARSEKMAMTVHMEADRIYTVL